jgi:response regulator RpfG family c-di-GMP phosphodiesterase
MTYKLLIVDDEIPNLRLLERLFSRDFQCLTAASGPDAIRLLEQHDVAILITDQRMPGMTGIELLKRTARLRPHMVRILLTGYTEVEALVEAINSGLVYMYITKPWNNDDLKLRVSRACEHYQNNKNRHALSDANQRLLLRLKEVKGTVVSSLADMLRIRDKHAYAHAQRVRHYALMIASKVGLSEEQQEDLSVAALLHNLGRIDVFRNGGASVRVSGVEQTISQAHAECEARLLHALPELANVAELVSCLSENFDGSGTPRGLTAEQIPLIGRILRLADEYDQMVLPKAAAPMTHDEAMRFLSQRSGKQFDPMIVEVLSQFTSQELDEKLTSFKGYGNHSRLRQDGLEAAYVDAITS